MTTVDTRVVITVTLTSMTTVDTRVVITVTLTSMTTVDTRVVITVTLTSMTTVDTRVVITVTLTSMTTVDTINQNACCNCGYMRQTSLKSFNFDTSVYIKIKDMNAGSVK